LRGDDEGRVFAHVLIRGEFVHAVDELFLVVGAALAGAVQKDHQRILLPLGPFGGGKHPIGQLVAGRVGIDGRGEAIAMVGVGGTGEERHGKNERKANDQGAGCQHKIAPYWVLRTQYMVLCQKTAGTNPARPLVAAMQCAPAVLGGT
jgi:hypothetical protein